MFLKVFGDNSSCILNFYCRNSKSKLIKPSVMKEHAECNIKLILKSCYLFKWKVLCVFYKLFVETYKLIPFPTLAIINIYLNCVELKSDQKNIKIYRIS